MSGTGNPLFTDIPMAKDPVEKDKVKEEALELDFGDDETLLKHMNRSHYVVWDYKGYPVFRFNWVVSGLASVALWAVVIYCMVGKKEASEDLGKLQSWVTQNFTWLYIGSQDIWALFLIWLCFSKYGNLKLGKDDEKPAYDDLSWFAMLFACGIGIGLYYWGVSEPIYYYTSYPNLMKPGWQTDDQRAQMALFLADFHWGIHGWVVYIVVALSLGVVCYRGGHPMTMRFCFYPLLGEKITQGFVGDLIDALSITCTTFGVCTSLGMGVESIANGIHRLDDSAIDPDNKDHKIIIIVVVTIIATMSVLSGLDVGIKILSNTTFAMGNFLMLALLFFDNTWFMLGTFVQSMGFYATYLVQVGFDCDAFQQLNYELQKESLIYDDPTLAVDDNLQMGTSGSSSLMNRITQEGIDVMNPDPASFFGQSPTSFMDFWTIFYWGWWISWAPFVGMFIARISRGRTIRNIIVGSFFAPSVFTFFWFSVFGSLGIKMQRVAEMVLVDKTEYPDYATSSPDCAALGYNGTKPSSQAAKDLADMGYYALSCRGHATRIYDIVQPYTGMEDFLTWVILIGVCLYFITSSDSGSYVDDMLSAGGHTNPPAIQKVYWAWMEGLTAIALVYSGGQDSLTALRAVSIVAGLPYTFAVCCMCTALYRAVKIEAGDADICNAPAWSTHVFDLLSGFDEADDKGERIRSLAMGFIWPQRSIYRATMGMDDNRTWSVGISTVMVALYYTGFGLIVGGYSISTSSDNVESYRGVLIASLGWVFYMFFAVYVAGLRSSIRIKLGIYGGSMEDLWTTMTMPGFVLSQFESEVKFIAEDKTEYIAHDDTGL